jgi:hypothetical protein
MMRAARGFGPDQHVLVEDSGLAFGHFASEMQKKSGDRARPATCKQRKDQRGMPHKESVKSVTLGCASRARVHPAS